MNTVDVLRWAFVSPAAVFGWVIALNVGFGVERFLYGLCPPEQIVSGSCRAEWYIKLSPNLFPVYTALAAVLVVLLPMLVAPSHRFKVGIVFYVLGSVAAFALSFGGGAGAEAFSALVTGLVTLFVYKQLANWPSKPSTNATKAG